MSSNQGDGPSLMDRLRAVPRREDGLNYPDFVTSPNTPGEKSVVASLQADAALAVQDGRSNPFIIAVPAFESFTSNGTAGDSEPFALSNDLIDAPTTQSVVVYVVGTGYVQPDNIDYANDEVDVTDPGSNNNVYIYYTAGDAGTLTLQKRDAEGNNQETVFTANLATVHRTDQSEQPEALRFDGLLDRFLGTDQFLEVAVDVGYQVRFSDPNGDGSEPTNALIALRIQRAQEPVPGLPGAVRARMGRN